MNHCPNCKSDNFALIIRGMDVENVINELIKMKKIYLEDYSDDQPHADNSRWICNVCLTRWGSR